MLRRLVADIDGALTPSMPVGAPQGGAPPVFEDGPADVLAAMPGSTFAADPGSDAGPGAGDLHVIFELGGSPFAVPAAALVEVRPFTPPMPIPGVSPWVLGIESFQAETLSIVDLAAFFGFASLLRSEDARTLVVFDPRSRRRPLTGLAVDAVATHEWLPSGGPGNPSTATPLAGRLGRLTRRILERRGRALTVLDLEALLLSPDFSDTRS